MSPEAIYTLAIVGLMLLALVFEIMAPDVIVFSALGLLFLFGILTPTEAFQGFSNSGMLTVGILFIVAYAAQTSGILEFFANRIMGNVRGGRRALLRMVVPVLGLSAFLNNTPIVAMFIPTVRDWALSKGLAPSKFLIPLSYAAILGGTCTLIGTSTNLVVDGLLKQSTNQSISMFELAWVGIPCVGAGVLYMLIFGFRALPGRRDLPKDLREPGREYMLEMKVLPNSPLAGLTVKEAGLRRLDDIYLAEITRNGETLAPVKPTDQIVAGDYLHFTGSIDGIVRLQKFQGLVPSQEREFCDTIQKSGRGRIVEAVVSRSSPMLGKTIREGNFRARYDAAILAVHRHGELVGQGFGRLVLKPGDTLLLLAGEDFFKRWNQARDFYLISKVSDLPVVDRKKSLTSFMALFGMVVLAASGVLDILQAAILVAMVLLLTRTVTIVEARRSIELNVLIVIAASFGISQALLKTGAASFLAHGVIDAVGRLGPVGLLAAIYFVTMLLTELITNNAAAALVFPVAMSAASQAGLDPKPFAIAIAMAASASFSTPIGYQTNLMVYGPGGYRFTDFMKVGIPLNLICMAVAVTMIPLVWKF